MENRVDLMVDGMVNALLVGGKKSEGGEFWPVDPMGLEPLYSDECAKKVLEIYERSQRAEEPEEIYSSFKNPSRIWNFLPAVIMGSKAIGLEKEKRLEISSFLLDAIEHLKSRDIACESGNNLVLSQGDVDRKLGEREFVEPSQSYKGQLLKLVASLWNYSEALFYQWHRSGREVHGLYDATSEFGSNTSLLVRDYLDLNPVQLWPDHLKDFPYNSVKIGIIYENIDCEFDVFNNFVFEGSTKEKMVSSHLLLNKNSKEMVNPDEGELENFTDSVLSKITQLSNATNAYSREEKILQHINSRFYTLKPVSDYIENGRWKPSQAVAERAKNFGVLDLPEPESPEEPEKLLRRNLDPRDDFLTWKKFYRANLLGD